MSEYGLLVAFPDQSESFTLGFEAGQCWERLEVGDIEDCTIHTENEEVVRRIARHFFYDVEFERTDVDGWSTVKFRRGRPRLQAVPNGDSGNA